MQSPPTPVPELAGPAHSIDSEITWLLHQLDRLERRGLIVRHHDPRDRRLRIPVITDDGEALRETVAGACTTVKASVLKTFGQDQVRALRIMLITIIGDAQDRGSCL